MVENINVNRLASKIAKSPMYKAYTIHMNTPMVNTKYMMNEMPWVLRFLIVLSVCGKKAMVVVKAAKNPKISMILSPLHQCLLL